MTDSVAAKLHAESIVIDAVCPLVKHDPHYLDWYREGGVTVVAPTVTVGTQDAREAWKALGMWQRLLRERSDLLLVRQASDIELAKKSWRLGIYLHCQGADALDDNLDLVDAYKAAGVGMIQLTYNVKNRVGDGCEERTDAGLSNFGVKLIERLNKARIIVDCTHTGLRTSLEAIECSTAPVVLSHSNVAKLHPSARNVGEELITAVAGSGGVIGAVGYPGMVSTSTTPTLDQFIAHIDALVELAGIDHVALGIDYYSGQAGVASDEDARRMYDMAVRAGMWGPSYPPPPHRYPTGIETPRTLQNLTRRLLERGYNASDVRKILGENWLRVMRSVWG